MEPERRLLLNEEKGRFLLEEDRAFSHERRGLMVILNGKTRRAEEVSTSSHHDPETLEVIVDLRSGRVVSLVTMAEGVQPAYTPQDYEDCERIVQSDPRIAEALAARGSERRPTVALRFTSDSRRSQEVHGRSMGVR